MTYFRKNIDDLSGYVPGFQPSGADVTKLNTNENPYPPSPKVLEALQEISTEKLRRYPQPLGDDFRNAAAGVMGVTPDNIMCTNGGDDLLTIALRSFCDETNPLAYPTPTYSLYPVLAKLQNCNIIEVPFDEDFNLPPQLADTIASLTIVCNPNAPSGTFIEPSELGDLADRLKGKSVLLIDEAYVDYAETNCLELVKSCENVMILRSMSKGYSLAGIRFGYAVANKNLIDGMMKVKDSYNVDAAAIAASTAAISDQEYFKKNVERINADKQKLTEDLRQLGLEVRDSQSNFVLAKCTGKEAAVIYDQLAKRQIYIRYFNLPGLSDKLRITVGTKEQNNKLIDALKDIMLQ